MSWKTSAKVIVKQWKTIVCILIECCASVGECRNYRKNSVKTYLKWDKQIEERLVKNIINEMTKKIIIDFRRRLISTVIWIRLHFYFNNWLDVNQFLVVVFLPFFDHLLFGKLFVRIGVTYSKGYEIDNEVCRSKWAFEKNCVQKQCVTTDLCCVQ